MKERIAMIEDILLFNVAVVLRSRRRVVSENDIEALLFCLVSAVGIDVSCEKKRVRRLVMGKYIGGQRSENNYNLGTSRMLYNVLL